MLNSLSLTTKDKVVVNGIRQKGNGAGSIYLYTYNNRIRSTMFLNSEPNPHQTDGIFVLKTDKTATLSRFLTHHSDHKFSSFRSTST